MPKLPTELLQGQQQKTNPITNTAVAQPKPSASATPVVSYKPVSTVKPIVVPKVPTVNKLFAPTVANAPISAVYGQAPSHAGEWTGKGVHTGTDYGVGLGTAAFAEAAGKVIHAGYDPAVGNYVTLETSPGHSINYEHLSSIGVKQGQSVTGGFQLGKTGDTGSASEAPHLHVEYTAGGNLVAPESYWNIKNEKDEPGWLHNGENDSAPQNLGSAFRYAGMSPREVSGDRSWATAPRSAYVGSSGSSSGSSEGVPSWGTGAAGSSMSDPNPMLGGNLQSVGVASKRKPAFTAGSNV